MTWQQWCGGAGAALLLLLLPFVLSTYALIVLSEALVLAIACLGVNLLLGQTGLLSLGHAAFFGVGAYTGGFLYALSPINAFELYLLSGVLTAAALAALVGFLCVRVTKMPFAILTLAFAQMVHALFVSGIIFRPFGGVGKGLFLLGGGGLYIPRLTMAGVEVAPEMFHRVFYELIVVLFSGCVILMWRIVHSPFGQALQAIRENETRAVCIGLRVRWHRWSAFLMSGIFAGLAGGLSGQLNRQVTPEQLHWLLSAEFVLAAVLGGTRHFLGPVVGAFGLVALQEVSLRFSPYRGLIVGSLLVVVVLACPGGLMGGGAALVTTMRGLGYRLGVR